MYVHPFCGYVYDDYWLTASEYLVVECRVQRCAMMPGFLFAAKGKKVLKSVNDDIFRFVCFFLLLLSFFFAKPEKILHGNVNCCGFWKWWKFLTACPSRIFLHSTHNMMSLQLTCENFQIKSNNLWSSKNRSLLILFLILGWDGMMLTGELIYFLF